MKVLKFGGTSVANSENIKKIENVIYSSLKEDNNIIVVVSALSGITDKLHTVGLKASVGNSEYQKDLRKIEEQHYTVCRELFSESKRGSVLSKVKIIINQLEDICKGVFFIQELTNKTTDLILSHGEILSSTIIADYLNLTEQGVFLADPKAFIVTDSNYGSANVNFSESSKKIKDHFIPLKRLSVCPGFVAANKQNQITTLGRGGSDYTAAIIAALLDAESLEIWTDVDGMMTADPRYVSSSRTIRTISYEDAMELSHFGAKVIYPPTIQPVLDKNIPIRIKNTFAPENHGTLISNEVSENDSLVKGLSCIPDIALLNFKGSGMVGIPNFSNRLFRSLSIEKVNVILITQASSEHTITIGIKNTDVERSSSAIEKEFEGELADHRIDPLEIEKESAIIALVGSNMKKQVGVSGQMLSTLGENGINIKAIAQGSSERNISVVIQKKHIRKALSSLHESFFLSATKRVNLFVIGVGNVGGTFIEQVLAQQKFLIETYHLDLRIIGIANSKLMLFNQEGIALESWRNQLLNSTDKFEKAEFLNQMKGLNLRNSVFIDNTDSSEIADLYLKVLSSSISIVTPNKIACSSDYLKYKKLKETAVKNKARFLFETNVGAGLPIISTINDLVKSGDKVNTIEAVLSGSLNFIFNNYDGKTSFRTIVDQAMAEGYTEPDPRIDLSGVDVIRKILILIRECGYEFNMDQVENQAFIPDHIMNTPSVDDFLQKLKENEDVFQALVEKANKMGARLKYVARFNNGVADSGIRYITKDHPFYQLEGKDNIVLLHTERYKEQPLVVKGAGAGASVTASGIFADVIRLANR